MFSPTRSRLPFFIDDLYGGFAKAQGMLRVEQDALGIEFQVKDSITGGLIKSKLKDIRLTFDQVESVEYKQNVFVASFRIRLLSLQIAKDIPVSDKGILKLKIARSERKKAKEIISNINLLLSEHRLG
ncbi:MAG: hypothetical protein AAF399_23270 [Bacteroidota bacterium]